MICVNFLLLAPFFHSLLSEASSLAPLFVSDVKHLGNSVCLLASSPQNLTG